MSNEFLESLQGSGSHIVQHIPSIHKFESTDSQAGISIFSICQLADETNNVVSTQYFQNKIWFMKEI
jgi:hypothetical protein